VNKSTTDALQVIVDDREVVSGIVPELQEMEGVAVAIQRLPVGDYLIGGKLLVERKTLADFAASIKDGRLLRQASRLASCPFRRALILEGTADDLLRTRMRREAIQGAIISITIIFGIPLLRSRDPKESARLLIYAAKQIGNMSSRQLPRSGKRPQGRRRIQIHILQGLPGVGSERARRLLDAFGSVQDVITAQADQLAQVSGIGAKTAQAIRWAVVA